MKKIKNIIFDFDGVLVDSNEIKKQAFFDIFSDISDIKNSQNIISEVHADDKKTRFGLVEEALKKLKNSKLIDYKDLEKEKEKYISKYSNLVEEKIIEGDEIFGAEESLKKLFGIYDLFIVSATPEENLKKIVVGRGLIKYFKEVCGIPQGDFCCDKGPCLERMIEEQNIKTSESVFVGDSNQDIICAKGKNITFIGVINDSNDFESRKDIQYKLNDLYDLPQLIRRIR